MKPKISMIIPVYNVEEYLRRCLDSCINQTFREMEIIAVDDCSTDGSAGIMREYEKQYPHLVRCLYLDQNIRQGGARNRGMEIARGRYLIFVDSDDYIEETMCEELYHSAARNNADMVICNFYEIKDGMCQERAPFFVDRGLESEEDIDVSRLLHNQLKSYSCNRIIKKEMLERNGLRYPERMTFEDTSVLWIWTLYAKKINYVRKPFYYYCRRQNSTVNSMCRSEYRQDYAKAIMSLFTELKQRGFFEQYGGLLQRIIWTYAAHNVCDYIKFGRDEEYEQMRPLLDLLKEHFHPVEERIEDCPDLFPVYRFCIKSLIQNTDRLAEGFGLVKRKLDYLKENQKKLALWGYGHWGKWFLAYLQKCGCPPDYIIDRKLALSAAKTEEGIPLCSFDEVKEDCDVIIVTIEGLDILQTIKQRIHAAHPQIRVIWFADLVCGT